MNTQLEKSDFRDIYCTTDGEKRIFCFRTGITVYEEVFENNRYMAAGWNSSGYPLNVLDNFPARLNTGHFNEPQAFDIEADGVSLSWDWQYADFEQFEEKTENTDLTTTHAILTLKSSVKPLTVRIHTLLDGTPVLTRWLEIENTGDSPLNINAVAPISGGIEAIDGWKEFSSTRDPQKNYSIGYMDCAVHNHEGYFKWHDLPCAEYSITGKYKTDRHRQPAFFLRNNLLGNMMVAQMGWSGGFRFSFLHDADTPTDKLSFRMEMESQKPIIVLAPSEVFESPKVHIGMIFGDLDDSINAMHEHLRKTVFTAPDVDGVKGWIVGGMGPERLMDVTASKHFIDTISAVGGETFIIDAGWFCPLGTECSEWWTRTGDWYPDKERYPNGIEEVRDYAHAKGLKFGLWLDLERIGFASRIYNEHPEWAAECYFGERKTTILNMAIDEAAAWATSELERVIKEYKIDLFRLDYNIGMGEILCKHTAHGTQESYYARYYKNTNKMYRELKRKYPNVIFENCAGGGGRTDVEFVSNFTHTWVSDCAIAPRSFTITNGMTMVLPPEVVDRLVSGMHCHTKASLDFQVRNTIFGRPTTNDYNPIGSVCNPDQMAFVKHTFDIYKQHIRPYIQGSKIYHHTPELVSTPVTISGVMEHPVGVGVIERSCKDSRHGVIGIFKLCDSTEKDVITVYPKGIDPSLNYNVTFDNSMAGCTVSGFELINNGLRVKLPGSLTSELIIYTAQ